MQLPPSSSVDFGEVHMSKTSRLSSFVLLSVLACSLISAGAPVPVVSATFPPGVTLTPVISSLTQPVLVTNAGDGSNRIFIVQQTGQIRIFKNGSLLGTDFLNISGLSNFTGSNGEMGLLGLAFDPNYSSNGFFYVTYDINTGNATFPYAVRLVRYHVSSNPDVADPASAFVILAVDKKFTNHNGGMIAFGPDGYLYWGTGDGGSGGDPDNNAQNLQSLLGKMLRLDVDSTPPSGKTYVIPTSNPFFNNSNPAVKKEIWAYGLRNPWRWSFDRSNGNLFIGDVGQNIEEEIDFQPASSTGRENYGWHVKEGNLCYSPSTNCTPPAHYVAPVAVYDHGAGDINGCAVTGGYVYRGSASPTLQGVYFYSDFCSGNLWALVKNASNVWTSKLITSTGLNVSSFGQDEQGELYLASYGTGQILKISQINVVTAQAFISEGLLDGTILETAQNSGIGGPKDSVGQDFTLGDTVNRRQWRAILSFNTSSLPNHAVITSAQLMIKLDVMTTPDPFSTLGKLKVDMAVPRFGTRPRLQKLDFQAAPTFSGVTAFNPVPNAGWYTATIAKAYRGSINRLGRTQFRLRFGLDDNNDSVANSASFFSGDAVTAADRPQLIIQYYIP